MPVNSPIFVPGRRISGDSCTRYAVRSRRFARQSSDLLLKWTEFARSSGPRFDRESAQTPGCSSNRVLPGIPAGARYTRRDERAYLIKGFI